jgi:arylsulfatase A-like enzyme
MSHYPNQEEKGAGGGGKNRAPDANATEMMGITDRTLGQVVDAIEQLGLKGSTYVFYTTDHGTPGRNAPLTGGKGTVSEGGLRVPFLVAGPGVAAGACSHVRVSGTDWLPTVAELAGVNEPLPKEVEGGSLASVLKGAGQGVVLRPREEFVVHFPHYDKDAIGPATALYLGDWKLVRIYASGERRLFDLSQDLVERDDLAKSQPQKAAELDQRLTDYLKAVNAQMPNVNASVPASQRPAEKKGGKGKGKQ